MWWVGLKSNSRSGSDSVDSLWRSQPKEDQEEEARRDRTGLQQRRFMYEDRLEVESWSEWIEERTSAMAR